MEAKKVEVQADKWITELDEAIKNATLDEEKNSLKHFRAAILPLLKKPEQLRTLLGKIAQGAF